MSEAQSGTPVVALRFMRNPSGCEYVMPNANGVILHEIPESKDGRHRFFVKWENGCIFYVFAEEIAIQ